MASGVRLASYAPEPMPKEPNKVLRAVVPLVLILVGLGVAASVLVTSTKPNPRTSQNAADATRQAPASDQARADAPAGGDPTNTPDPASASLGAGDAPPAETPSAETPSAEAVAAETRPASPATPDEDDQGQQAASPPSEPAATVPVVGTLRARAVPPQAYDAIGSLDASGPFNAKVQFTPIGAGVASYRLAGEFTTVQARTAERLGEDVGPEEHVEVQAIATRQLAGGLTSQTPPFAALSLTVDGQAIPLVTAPDLVSPVWRQTEPGAFEAVIEDEAGEAVLRVERRYILEPASYDVRLEQRVVNLSDAPRRVTLSQFGPIDLPPDRLTYGGDKRRFRFGYILKPSADPTRSVVLGEGYLKTRESGFVLGSKTDGLYPVANQLWPNPESERKEHELVWAGTTGRYFGVAIHPDFDPSAPPASMAIQSIAQVDRVMLNTADRLSPIVLRLKSPEVELPARGEADLSFRVYAGPLSKAVIADNPVADASGLEELVVYNFGGPFAFCTFPVLTQLLITTLRGLNGIFADYALAIVALVVIVRIILHPITRWSQIRVQRFGKQIADMAPEQKKVQEKYKDDPKKMQEEMAKLWRERGVNPAGALGCLPMFLQSFIWVALYATLFFAYELRHEPAFYGIFQTLTGGSWGFLADMASPDALVRLPEKWHFDLPLMGTIRSVNILPLVYAGVFFVQQKYLTPPTSATLTPEQEAQQKLIKVLFPIMMPIIIYNAPSGLAVYMLFSGSLAILENIWIRQDIKKKGLLDVPAKGSKPKKPRKQGGFLERLEKLAEEQKRMQEEKLKEQYRQAGYKAKTGVPGQKKESAADRLRRKK